jgi:hypothetical protein
MHQNHFSSWFKLFGSWSQFGRRARNGIKYSERTRNGIKRDQTCLSAELQTILKSGSHPLHLVLCVVLLDKTWHCPINL